MLMGIKPALLLLLIFLFISNDLCAQDLLYKQTVKNGGGGSAEIRTKPVL